MHTNYVLFLLSISKQDQEISPCSFSRLSLPGRGHILVKCSHTRTLFLLLLFLDLLWNSLVPSTPYIKYFLVNNCFSQEDKPWNIEKKQKPLWTLFLTQFSKHSGSQLCPECVLGIFLTPSFTFLSVTSSSTQTTYGREKQLPINSLEWDDFRHSKRNSLHTQTW